MKLRLAIMAAVVLMFLTAGWGSNAGAASGESAGSIVQALHAALLDAMRAGNSIGFRERYERLAPVIRRTHDLPKIARISLGSYWRKLDKQQRLLFVTEFSRLSISIYASRFKSYGGERFTVVAEKATRHGGMLVQSRLVKASGKAVHLDYQLRRKKGRWLIVNVIANGVSDLALKRAEYSAIVRQQGFPPLLARLREKRAQYDR